MTPDSINQIREEMKFLLNSLPDTDPCAYSYGMYKRIEAMKVIVYYYSDPKTYNDTIEELKQIGSCYPIVSTI